MLCDSAMSRRASQPRHRRWIAVAPLPAERARPRPSYGASLGENGRLSPRSELDDNVAARSSSGECGGLVAGEAAAAGESGDARRSQALPPPPPGLPGAAPLRTASAHVPPAPQPRLPGL